MEYLQPSRPQNLKKMPCQQLLLDNLQNRSFDGKRIQKTCFFLAEKVYSFTQILSISNIFTRDILLTFVLLFIIHFSSRGHHWRFSFLKSPPQMKYTICIWRPIEGNLLYSCLYFHLFGVFLFTLGEFPGIVEA